MLGKDKTFCDGVIYRSEQGIVILAHIEQANGLFVGTGLCPGDGSKSSSHVP